MWNRILGNDHLIRVFDEVVKKNRLAHAYLFVGPVGLGKQLFALELAKALLCEGPPSTPELGERKQSLEACDRCPSCLQVEARTHPDFFVVGRPEDKNEIPIESMRELCRSFGLKSARGKGKVAILDDADDLNEESANCFLKTLEEPPPRSVFILIGKGAERQLPTVVSRCQVVRFSPLSGDQVTELLQRQGIKDPALLPRLVRLSEGSPGQALELADPTLWTFRKQLLQELAKPRPDTVRLGKEWLEFCEEAGKEGAVQRPRAHQVLRLLMAALKDALALSLGNLPIQPYPEDAPFLKNLAERLGTAKILSLMERCLEAESHIDRYVPLNLVLEGLMDAWGQKV